MGKGGGERRDWEEGRGRREGDREEIALRGRKEEEGRGRKEVKWSHHFNDMMNKNMIIQA